MHERTELRVERIRSEEEAGRTARLIRTRGLTHLHLRMHERTELRVERIRSKEEEDIDQAVRKVDIGERHSRRELVGDAHACAA